MRSLILIFIVAWLGAAGVFALVGALGAELAWAPRAVAVVQHIACSTYALMFAGMLASVQADSMRQARRPHGL